MADSDTGMKRFYESVLNTVHEGLWVTDADDRIIFFNRGMERIAGVAARSVMGLSVVRDFPEQVVGPLLPHYARARATLQPVPYEVAVVTPASRHMVQAGTLTPCVAEGRFTGMICTIQDVTEVRRVERESRASCERAQRYLNIAPAIILALDPAGAITLLNEEGCRILECEPAAAVGLSWFETFLPSADRDGIRDVFARLLAGDVSSVEDYENEIVTLRTRRTRSIHWHNTLLRGDDGAVIGLLRSGQDITEQRGVEQDYQMLFMHAQDGIAVNEIICDEHGEPIDHRFLAVNPAFERMIGLRAEEVLGRTILEVLPEIEPHWIVAYGKVALTGEPVTFENYAAELGKHFRVTAFRNAPGQFAAVFADITERIRLQNRLEQSQKLESIGRLAGGVAHDFNNLLMGIMNYVELCRDGVDAEHPIRHWLDEITRDAERSAGIVRQLLAFARRQAVAPRATDLNEATAGMLKMLGRLIGEDVDLVWHPGIGEHTVLVDPSQIDQILTNLAVNARDAMRDAGQLIIETAIASVDETYCREHVEATPGEFVVLSVSDSGCGIAKEVLDHIFEPFFTTKGQCEGTGLGLATVYGIVKQNNGFLNVYSEPGRGTTFRIYLPRHEQGVPDSTESAAAPALACGGETILLVEDEKSVRITTQLFLQAMGYTVLSATQPEEALAVVREHRGEIHLLVTDVVMPGMSGRDLARELASQFPRLGVLYMSGYTANVIEHHGVLEKGVHFLSKPFSRDALAHKVREVLG